MASVTRYLVIKSAHTEALPKAVANALAAAGIEAEVTAARTEHPAGAGTVRDWQVVYQTERPAAPLTVRSV